MAGGNWLRGYVYDSLLYDRARSEILAFGNSVYFIKADETVAKQIAPDSIQGFTYQDKAGLMIIVKDTSSDSYTIRKVRVFATHNTSSYLVAEYTWDSDQTKGSAQTLDLTIIIAFSGLA